jgi:hypothetical protein
MRPDRAFVDCDVASHQNSFPGFAHTYLTVHNLARASQRTFLFAGHGRMLLRTSYGWVSGTVCTLGAGVSARAGYR